MGDEAFDPALRPVADVGTMSVTLTSRADESVQEAAGVDERHELPEYPPGVSESAQPPGVSAQDVPERDRMQAAGFRLRRGAWVRG